MSSDTDRIHTLEHQVDVLTRIVTELTSATIAPVEASAAVEHQAAPVTAIERSRMRHKKYNHTHKDPTRSH